ncbi:MAG: cation transporter [Pedobacter sp.]|uniref:heavy-metal-associated domain-containing protein n=1 Tax=Pedobacter sp. TaxID=1411316 RepID=UPI0035617E16
METLKFKTNIKCSGCIAAVTPFLNDLPEIENWAVDTDNPEKILTVEASDDLTAETIVKTIEKAGYIASEV